MWIRGPRGVTLGCWSRLSRRSAGSPSRVESGLCIALEAAICGTGPLDIPYRVIRQPRCASLSLSAGALRPARRRTMSRRVARATAALARPSRGPLLLACWPPRGRAPVGTGSFFAFLHAADLCIMHDGGTGPRAGVDPECEWIGRSSKDYGMTSVSNQAPLTVRSGTQPPYFDSSIFLWRVGPRICTIAAKPHVQHHLLNDSSPSKNIRLHCAMLQGCRQETGRVSALDSTPTRRHMTFRERSLSSRF